MTDKKRLRSDWPVWGVILLTLLATYFGAYGFFVERLTSLSFDEIHRATEYVPGYYAGNDQMDEALAFFFWPAHAVDRVVRKSHWKTLVEPREYKSPRRKGVEGAEPTNDGGGPK